MAWHYTYGNGYYGYSYTQDGYDNADEIVKQLLTYGWTYNAIYATLANIQAEGELNPAQIQHGYSVEQSEAGRGGYGLCQWDNKNNYCIKTWLTNHGYDIYSGYGQIECLNTGEVYKPSEGTYGAQWLDDSTDYSGYMTFDDFKNSSADVEKLAVDFEEHYERAGEKKLETRKKYAREWANHYGSTPLPNIYSLNVEPTILTLNYGDTAIINVNAISNNNNWAYTLSQGIAAVLKQDGSLRIRATTLAQGAAQVKFWLTDDNSVTASCKILLNGASESTDPEPVEDDYINLNKTSVRLDSGERFMLTVDASGAWSYAISGGLLYSGKTSNSLTITTTTGTTTTGLIRVTLKSNPSIYATCSVYINQDIPEPEVNYYLTVSPSFYSVKRGSAITIFVDTNGAWSYDISNAFEVLKKTSSYLRIKAKETAILTDYNINFNLSNNPATIASATIRVKESKSWFIYSHRFF